MITIQVKEVANGFLFTVGKDDNDIWCCEGNLETIDAKELGKMILEIIRGNS